MKYKIYSFLFLIIFTACLRITSTPTTGDFNPISGVLPNDANENLNFSVNIENLNNNEVIMIISNELYNNLRENNIVFQKTFNSLSINKNIKNEKITKNPLIIEKKFQYDYSRKLIPKTINRDIISKSAIGYKEGDVKTFNALKIGTSEKNITVKAKLVKIVDKNNRIIKFWVDENKYSGEQFIDKKINNSMVNILSQKFIENTNNIYGDLTHIFGQEWFEGTSNSNYLLDGNRSIDILLFDINENYNGGRVVGYFNPDDLFLKNYAFHSNESVMFYLDAYSYADSSPWNETEYWPDNAISTLAHEFMHLITFYQKTVLRDGKISIWLNEMISMLAEDIVSYDINTYGPRGVLGSVLSSGEANNGSGRLSYANYYNNYPVNAYSMDTYIEYSVTYSYGAYLLRNYGSGENGLKFLRDIIWSTYQDTNAIEYAIKNRGFNKSFINTLQDWGKAIVLSNNEYNGEEKFKYNTGNGFTASIDGKQFKVGDINMYNYIDSPTFYETGGSWLPKLNRGNNLLFYLGKGNGAFSMSISLPKYSRMQFIIKDSTGKFDLEKSENVQVNQISE